MKKTAIILWATLFALAAALVMGAPPETPGLLLAGAAALDVATVGFGHSAKAYCDKKGKPATEAPTPILANHHFSVDADGCLVHAIDGRLRATVPPAGLDDYAALWPDCRGLVKQLKAADASARATRASSRPGGASAARKGPKG